jgi:RimJ/RimL family protein N-acetyltransferase
VPVELRRVRAEDWRDLRALRLEALADTPIGFLETLADAKEQPEEAWQARAARGAEGGESFQVMAWDGERPVGNCVCRLRDGAAWLAAVYVTSARRGTGLLAELVERCSDWARERGMTALRLEVNEDNTRARTAYARLGFRETGDRQPYDLDPTRDELVMERAL